MRFVSCCRDCSCWCIFIVSMVIFILSLAMAIDDLSLIIDHQQAVSAIQSSSQAELKCVEICRNWYRQEREIKCCDIIEAGICIDKQVCRREYIASQEGQISNLKANSISEIITATICLFTVIMVVYCQMKQRVDISEEDLGSKVRKVLLNFILENKIDFVLRSQTVSYLDEEKIEYQDQQSSQNKQVLQINSNIGIYLTGSTYNYLGIKK